MKIKILFLLSFLLYNSIRAQIVNIESKRLPSDTSGFSGSAEAGLSFNKNVNSFLILDLKSHIQYKSKDLKNLYMFLTNFRFFKSQNQKYENSGFVHFRYNRKVNNFLRWELFVQSHYNSIDKIAIRQLAGTGPRFKIEENDKIRIYLGSLYMYEYEKLIDKITKENNHRWSSYISFTYFPVDNIILFSTTYYQPLFANFKDFRIHTENTFQLKIIKSLYLKLSFLLNYDTRPAPDITNLTYSFQNGLAYRF